MSPASPALHARADRRAILIPVCGWCQRIRTPEGAWRAPAQGHLEAAGPALTHGVCPDCARTLRRRS